jgi:hypothetical protein
MLIRNAEAGLDVIESGPEPSGTQLRPRGHPALALLTVTVMLAVGAALNQGAAPATPPTPSPTPTASGAAMINTGPVGSDALLIAQLCLDARHVALVANALRHDQPLTLGRVRGWCR